MKIYNKLGFSKFTRNDVECFAEIMKRAFDKDAHIHLGEKEGGPEGYENGNFIKKWYLHEHASAFTVYKNEKPIGAINVFINTKTNENFLGNMFVDPDIQDHGIGLIMWKYIEQKYPETKIWRTETPSFSRRNHNFYINKCGFKLYKIENPKDIREGSYLLEKIMK